MCLHDMCWRLSPVHRKMIIGGEHSDAERGKKKKVSENERVF